MFFFSTPSSPQNTNTTESSLAVAPQGWQSAALLAVLCGSWHLSSTERSSGIPWDTRIGSLQVVKGGARCSGIKRLKCVKYQCAAIREWMYHTNPFEHCRRINNVMLCSYTVCTFYSYVLHAFLLDWRHYYPYLMGLESAAWVEWLTVLIYQCQHPV